VVYKGHVKKGVVIVDDPVILPEGLKGQIEPLPAGQTRIATDYNT